MTDSEIINGIRKISLATVQNPCKSNVSTICNYLKRELENRPLIEKHRLIWNVQELAILPLVVILKNPDLSR